MSLLHEYCDDRTRNSINSYRYKVLWNSYIIEFCIIKFKCLHDKNCDRIRFVEMEGRLK